MGITIIAGSRIIPPNMLEYIAGYGFFSTELHFPCSFSSNWFIKQYKSNNEVTRQDISLKKIYILKIKNWQFDTSIFCSGIVIQQK